MIKLFLLQIIEVELILVVNNHSFRIFLTLIIKKAIQILITEGKCFLVYSVGKFCRVIDSFAHFIKNM